MTGHPPSPDAGESISVVVPSYGRPEVLRVCLEALMGQRRSPVEVLVVHRADDLATRDMARALASRGVATVIVERPGLLAALQAGARRARGSVIAMTDDDAAPRPDWIERLHGHFADPCVGGAGGRDSQPDTTRQAAVVGIVGAWGRVTGNHHIGHGPVRDVDVIKGVNMAWRREALAFPQGLRGLGTQMHTEIPIALWAHARGWRVVYDPEMVVEHRPAPRADGSRRLSSDEAYNLVAGMTPAGLGLVWRRLAYGLLLGDAAAPGLARGLVAAARRERRVLRDLRPSLLGQAAAAIDLMRGCRLRMVPLADLRPGDEPS